MGTLYVYITKYTPRPQNFRKSIHEFTLRCRAIDVALGKRTAIAVGANRTELYSDTFSALNPGCLIVFNLMAGAPA